MSAVMQLSLFNDEEERGQRWSRMVDTIYFNCFFFGIAIWISDKAVKQACSLFGCTERGFWNAYGEAFELACEKMYPNENAGVAQ